MCLGPMPPDASDFPGGIPAFESSVRATSAPYLDPSRVVVLLLNEACQYRYVIESPTRGVMVTETTYVRTNLPILAPSDRASVKSHTTGGWVYYLELWAAVTGPLVYYSEFVSRSNTRPMNRRCFALSEKVY